MISRSKIACKGDDHLKQKGDAQASPFCFAIPSSGAAPGSERLLSQLISSP
jgi:hypothetical protein